MNTLKQQVLLLLVLCVADRISDVVRYPEVAADKSLLAMPDSGVRRRHAQSVVYVRDVVFGTNTPPEGNAFSNTLYMRLPLPYVANSVRISIPSGSRTGYLYRGVPLDFNVAQSFDIFFPAILNVRPKIYKDNQTDWFIRFPPSGLLTFDYSVTELPVHPYTEMNLAPGSMAVIEQTINFTYNLPRLVSYVEDDQRFVIVSNTDGKSITKGVQPTGFRYQVANSVATGKRVFVDGGSTAAYPAGTYRFAAYSTLPPVELSANASMQFDLKYLRPILAYIRLPGLTAEKILNAAIEWSVSSAFSLDDRVEISISNTRWGSTTKVATTQRSGSRFDQILPCHIDQVEKVVYLTINFLSSTPTPTVDEIVNASRRVSLAIKARVEYITPANIASGVAAPRTSPGEWLRLDGFASALSNHAIIRILTVPNYAPTTIGTTQYMGPSIYSVCPAPGYGVIVTDKTAVRACNLYEGSSLEVSTWKPIDSGLTYTISDAGFLNAGTNVNVTGNFELPYPYRLVGFSYPALIAVVPAYMATYNTVNTFLAATSAAGCATLSATQSFSNTDTMVAHSPKYHIPVCPEESVSAMFSYSATLNLNHVASGPTYVIDASLLSPTNSTVTVLFNGIAFLSPVAVLIEIPSTTTIDVSVSQNTANIVPTRILKGRCGSLSNVSPTLRSGAYEGSLAGPGIVAFAHNSTEFLATYNITLSFKRYNGCTQGLSVPPKCSGRVQGAINADSYSLTSANTTVEDDERLFSLIYPDVAQSCYETALNEICRTSIPVCTTPAETACHANCVSRIVSGGCNSSVALNLCSFLRACSQKSFSEYLASFPPASYLPPSLVPTPVAAPVNPPASTPALAPARAPAVPPAAPPSSTPAGAAPSLSPSVAPVFQPQAPPAIVETPAISPFVGPGSPSTVPVSLNAPSNEPAPVPAQTPTTPTGSAPMPLETPPSSPTVPLDSSPVPVPAPQTKNAATPSATNISTAARLAAAHTAVLSFLLVILSVTGM